MVITLKGARVMADLTQEQAAEKIGVSTATYQRFEHDVGKMRVAQLERLARILGVSAADLIASHRSTQSSVQDHSGEL